MLNRIKNILAEFAPQIAESLLEPASKEEIDLLQSMVSGDLPKDLIELYNASKGNDPDKITNFFNGVPFISIEQTIQTLGEDDYLHNQSELNHADFGINSAYTFDKTRIPIGDDAGTCVICVDVSPTKEGTPGQVILIDYDYQVALKLANSVSEYLSDFEKDLKNGKYSLLEEALEDGVHWLQPDRDVDPVNWFNSPTWKYVQI